MYGIVQIISYIRFSITNAYSTQDISFISISLLRLVLENNLQWTGNKVEIGFQSCLSFLSQ